MEIDLHKNKEHAIKRLKNENIREIKLRDKLNEEFDCKEEKRLIFESGHKNVFKRTERST